MIRVLVVEDSPVAREFLVHILGSDPSLEIAGVATNGEEAVEAVNRLKPDIITMDIFMPKMDGFEATRRIMETAPTPIVIVSGTSQIREVAFSFRAIEAGALAVIPRPKGIHDAGFEESAGDLVRMIKTMAEVKVIKRWARLKKDTNIPAMPVELVRPAANVQVVAIGTSTGGPVALRTILSGLPKDFPVPLLIVQHIVPGFIPGFVDWLSQSSAFPVKIAEDRETALPGRAYVAPDGSQLRLGRGNRISLSDEWAENGLRPSAGHLFRSVAETCDGHSVGVLLTGMGTDGAPELKLMKEKQAVTIAQDEESSVIHGMPGEAIKLGAATYVLPLSKIAPALISLTRRARKEVDV